MKARGLNNTKIDVVNPASTFFDAIAIRGQ